MPIAFHKYHGCGNDFIVIDITAQPAGAPLDFSGLSPQWCHRQFGIGADQLLVVQTVRDDPSRLHLSIYNNDGSPAGMCGNGLRCIAKYACDLLGVPLDQVHITIGERTYPVAITRDSRGQFMQAHVAMGQPEFASSRIPLSIPDGLGLENLPTYPAWRAFPEAVTRDVTPIVNVEVSKLCPEVSRQLPASNQWRATCLSMGNPHAVIFLDAELEESIVQHAGPMLEHASCFPSRCNIHFARVTGPRDIRLLTWERGSGPTLACGSGACAVAVAGVLLDYVESNVSIHQRGGTVQVHVDPSSAMVTLSGPATHVYSGSMFA